MTLSLVPQYQLNSLSQANRENDDTVQHLNLSAGDAGDIERLGLRGLKKAKGEFLLMCIAHNLNKMAQWWTRFTPPMTLTTAVQERISAVVSLVTGKFNKRAMWSKNLTKRFEYAY